MAASCLGQHAAAAPHRFDLDQSGGFAPN